MEVTQDDKTELGETGGGVRASVERRNESSVARD